jgi:3' terminal RNA ribose 2'-O-methyltransferase Hen1
VVVCHDGPEFLQQLFEPLGYELSFQRMPLDERFPQWGEGVAYQLRLQSVRTISELLTHLYVLIPVLDNEKHYWVGEDEIEKLLQFGEGWLESHPLRDLITRRFLRHQHGLANQALARLIDEGGLDPEAQDEQRSEEERDLERPMGLQQQRLDAISAELLANNATRVVDLGCGSGDLLLRLARETGISDLVGMDVSAASLQAAKRRLDRERMPGLLRDRIKLLHGALTYVDSRLAGFDAAVLAEVIEHLDPPRLLALQRCVFEFARPGLVIMSTPNSEYNQLWPRLMAGQFRHRDHRFEWSRMQFQSWANALAEQYGYSVDFLGIGPAHEKLGTPTQAGVFKRCS